MSLGRWKRAKFVVNDIEISGRGWYNLFVRIKYARRKELGI